MVNDSSQPVAAETTQHAPSAIRRLGQLVCHFLSVRISLPRAVIGTWTFCVLIVGWVLWQIQTANLHPACWPLLALLTLFVLGTATVTVSAAWQVIRGPHRLRAIRSFLCGTLPVWLFAAHSTTVLWVTGERYVPVNTFILSGAALGASLGRVQLWLNFRDVTVGRRVVMYHNQEPRAEEQVAAMDRHVERLEQMLGRAPRVRANWVRGPLWGRDGYAFLGFAMSPPTNPWETTSQEPSPDGLRPIDRHELAHFTINQYVTPAHHPPFVITEGWAEAMCGYQPGTLARRAWNERAGGPVPTLRELVSREWYNCDDGPVYTLGGPLVEYILRTWGPVKFGELYTTCRRQTFHADCERILGITVDQLDHDYWADIDRQIEPPDDHYYQQLLKCRLADGVDREEFRKFAKSYAQAVLRANSDLPDGAFEGTYTRRTVDEAGKVSTSTEQQYSILDGDRCYSRVESPTGTAVNVITDTDQISLRKEPTAKFFTIDDRSLFAPRTLQKRRLHDRILSISERMGRRYGWLDDQFFQQCGQGDTEIEELRSVEVAGDQLAEVALRHLHPGPGTSPRQRYRFQPAKNWIVRATSAKTADAQGRAVYYESEYDVEAPSGQLPRTVGYRWRATVEGKPLVLHETTQTFAYREVTPEDAALFRIDTYPVKRSWFAVWRQVPVMVLIAWSGLAVWVLSLFVTQILIWRRSSTRFP